MNRSSRNRKRTAIPSKYKEFGRASLPYGGPVDIFDRDNPSNELKMLIYKAIEKKIKLLERSSPRFKQLNKKIFWGFVFNSTPNARAWKIGDKYFIGINSGLFAILYETYTALLSFNDVFKFFEGSEAEIINSEEGLPKNFLRDYYHGQQDGMIAYTHQFKPRSPKRGVFMNKMIIHAMEFVFLHELSHILMGHLDYLDDTQDLKMTPSLDENWGISDFQDKPIFEHHADNLAIVLAIKYLISDARKMDGQSAIEYSIWSCAIDLYLWVISKGPLSISGYESGKHPDPRIRLAYKFSKIVSIDFGASAFQVRLERGAKVVSSLFVLVNIVSIAVIQDLRKLGFKESVDQLYSGSYIDRKYTKLLDEIHFQEGEKAESLDQFAFTEAIFELCDGMLVANGQS